MAEPSVLLVDEDARRRRALEVGLRRGGFRVTVAGSAEQALWFLDHALPEVIVSASRFSQGMSSLSLAEMIRAREEWSSIVLIMIRDDDSEALSLADDVVGEGVTIASLAVRARQALFHRRVARLDRADGGLRRLTGSFAELTAIDLLRLIERLGCSGTLGVETPSGPATLWFADGRVIDGALGRFEGEDAVFRLLMVDEGSFELSLATSLHAEVIEAPMENLIGDCLRQLDEWMRLCGEVPPLDSCLRVDAESLESRRGELAEELSALIRSCDGRQTIREVVDSSDLGPLLALEAIQNLRGVGILVEGPSGGDDEDENENEGSLGGFGLGLKELPPLPAFPEPFPGLGAELGFEHDTALVSGIPEEISEEIQGGDSSTEERSRGRRGDAGGKPPTGRTGVGNEYVFRPPQSASSRGAEARAPSSSAIERAIDDAISGLERGGGGARAGQGLTTRGAANGRPTVAPTATQAEERSAARSAARPPAGQDKSTIELGDVASGDRLGREGVEERSDGADAKSDEERSSPLGRGLEATKRRLGRVVSLVRVREPRVHSRPGQAPDRSAFTLVAGTAAGELVVGQAEPSLVECEEAMALALRTPSVVINVEAVRGETASGDGAVIEGGEAPAERSEGGAADGAYEERTEALAADGRALSDGEGHDELDLNRDPAEAGPAEAGPAGPETATDEGLASAVARQPELVAGVLEDVEERSTEDPDRPAGPADGAPGADDGDVGGASISSAKRSLPATPVGIVVGEIVEPDTVAGSEAALALVPESSGDLERLGALAMQPPPSTSAAMWSARSGRSSVVLSPSISGSAVVHSPAQSGAAYSGAAYSGARSLAARSMAARSMAGVSAAHLFGADAAISRLAPAPADEDDEPVEFGRSMSGWWWVLLIGAASLSLWAWLHYGPGAGRGDAEDVAAGDAEAADRRSMSRGEGEQRDETTGEGSSTGDRDRRGVASSPGAAAEVLTAEESAALEAKLAEGESLHQQGAEEEASVLVAEVLARAPTNAAALLLRAKISLDRGDLALARESAKRAAKHSPELAEAYLTIGVVAEEQAEIADAIAAYERYLELAPDARYASGIRRQVASLRRKMP